MHMSSQQNDKSGNKSTTPNTLTDQDITTARVNGRRSFLGVLGITVLGATTIALGYSLPGSAPDSAGKNKKTKQSDFPKGTSDTNTTENSNSKAVDSDERNSKAVDTDQSRLRDVRKSSNTD
jgi:hypothetical protein